MNDKHHAVVSSRSVLHWRAFRRGRRFTLDRILGFVVLSLLQPWMSNGDAADPVLRVLLADGSQIEGTLVALDQPGRLGIRSKWFAQPMEISVGNLLEARVADSEVGEGDAGNAVPRYAFRMDDESQFVGAIVSAGDGEILLQTEDLGQVRLITERLSAVFDADQVPQPLLSLDDSRYRFRREAGWRFGDQGLMCDVPEAATVAELELPARFHLRIEVRCSGQADFELALGDHSAGGAGQGGTRVDRRGGSLSRLPTERFVTRVEWIGQSVSLVRSNASVSDAEVFDLLDDENQLELDLYVDQSSGRMVAFRDGVMLGDVSLADEAPVLRRELTLISRGDGVSVKRFDLFQWDGQVPSSRYLPERFTLLRDGTMIAGVAQAWDSTRFRIDQTWYAIDDLARMEFAIQIETLAGCSLTLVDGCRISGDVDGRGEDETFWLRDATGSRFAVPASRVVRVVGTPGELVSTGIDASELETQDARLWGQLEDGRPVGDTFAWRSSVIENRLGITAESGVTIRFASVPRESAQRPLVEDPESLPIAVGYLELRSGDRLPGELVAIDGRGLRFRSDPCGEISVGTEFVQRVGMQRATAIDESDLQYALSVPRRMKESPPTHVLVSSGGDVLRGRLLGMDQREARFEVRGTTRIIERAGIAEVLWLERMAEDPMPCRYVVTTRAGARLGLESVVFDGNQLLGVHRTLGDCRIPAPTMESLRFGLRVDLPRQIWRLEPVKEPKNFE